MSIHNQEQKRQAEREAMEAADIVASLGESLPAAQVQKIYDDVVFSFLAKTRLAKKMKFVHSSALGANVSVDVADVPLKLDKPATD
jgi:hypothetical protein